MDRSKIPRLVMDDYNLRILSATTFKERSARELAYLLDIPMATCYRKIKELLNAELLEEEESKLTKEGRRYKTYLSRVSAIHVSFENGKLKVGLQLTWNEPMEWVTVPGAPADTQLPEGALAGQPPLENP